MSLRTVSLRKRPALTAPSLAANRARAQKSTGPRTEPGKNRVAGNVKRDFTRLLGLQEAFSLDQEPGAAIHLYHELIAPYKRVPPLLAMHFRDLARLQLELQALERIRDAAMEYRAQQTELEVRRRRREMNREVGATAQGVYETGLCRLPDSFAKFREQAECLLVLKDELERRDLGMEPVLRRLYGREMNPDHERGQLICIDCRKLMKPPEGREPLTEHEFKSLMVLVEAEEHDVMEAWELALDEQRVTAAASRARLAPTREDHWMNRQGDRLRQAIDRKMKFTVTLLKVFGLAHQAGPTPRRKHRKPRANAKSICGQTPNVPSRQRDGGLGAGKGK